MLCGKFCRKILPVGRAGTRCHARNPKRPYKDQKPLVIFLYKASPAGRTPVPGGKSTPRILRGIMMPAMPAIAHNDARMPWWRQRAKSIGGEGIAELENSKAERVGTTNGLWRYALWRLGGKISLCHTTSFLAKSVNLQSGQTGYSRHINIF